MSESPNFIEIHHAFAETDYGRTLAGRVRYERYKPAEVSNERWVQLLGPDVNNLEHMPLTRGLAKAFIRHTQASQPDALSGHEADVLEVAAIVHDWGESVGRDITFSDKTEQDEAEERRQFGENLWNFYAGDAEEVKGLIREAFDDVVFSPDAKLGEMFNVIERSGYVRTALRAAEHLKNGTAPDCEAGMHWIIADVFGNQISKLTGYAGKYAAVQEYLIDQSEQIFTAFRLVGMQDFDNYELARRDEKRIAFEDAFAAFSLWQTNLGLRSANGSPSGE